MASKLTKLTAELASSQIQARSKQSMQWLLQKISEIRNPQYLPRGIKAEIYRERTRLKVGGLYCFYYDPKGKDDLPYWDKFPLALIIGKYPDGFLALNLHYLPIRHRAVFLDKLLDFAVMKGDDIVGMNMISYDLLAASKRYKEFRPCIKRYLSSHLHSKVLAIEPYEWEVATFLPLHQFKGEKPQAIWQDSLQQIRKS